ncbi:MAG TPA: hypothetical protein PK689_04400, partial [Kiritimatiellia bacterium]|nr:hypothetical protein [Kiritimatiellia bacterium]
RAPRTAASRTGFRFRHCRLPFAIAGILYGFHPGHPAPSRLVAGLRPLQTLPLRQTTTGPRR